MNSESRPAVLPLERQPSTKKTSFILSDGTRVTLLEKTTPRINPRPVAWHESAHVIGSDGEIIVASIVPEGKTGGHVRPRRMTPEGAMAAAGMGHDGVGWDTFITRFILRANPNMAAARGRAKVMVQLEEYYQVAVALEEKKVIGQQEVNQAYEKARKERMGIRPVEIEVLSPEGHKRVAIAESFQWQVDLSKVFSRN